MNDDAPKGRPLRRVRVQFSYKRDSQNNAWVSEAQNEVAERPRLGGGHHKRILIAYLTHMKQRRTVFIPQTRARPGIRYHQTDPGR